MRSIMFATILLLAGCGAQGDQESAAEKATVAITIPTAQCSMCEDAITTALMGVEGVSSASVNLESKTVEVTYSTATLKLSDLETAISKAGYAANNMAADAEAYDGLPACCKVPDDGEAPAMDSM